MRSNRGEEGGTRETDVAVAPTTAGRRRVLSGAAGAFVGLRFGTIRGAAADRGTPTGREAVAGGTTPGTPANADARLGFVGDVMLGRNVDERYADGDENPAAIWGDLRPRLNGLDGVWCNLECCLSTRGERFPDRAFYFRADPAWAGPALVRGNVAVAATANNHALDYGETALRDTLDALETNGIEYAGAGEDPAAARAPSLVSVGDVDVATVSVADHFEAYAAADDRAGIAHVECDPENAETRRIVTEAFDRANARDPDVLVASVHWGPNWAEFPDETLRAFGRWLVDAGATVVHGHSAHVVQGIERYGDGLIIHDAGDFVDDYAVDRTLRNDRSFLFEVAVDDGDLAEVRLVPVVIEDCAVRRAEPEETAWLRKTIADRSDPFDTDFEYDGDELVVR